MLRRLTIEDYGLLARAEIDFTSGATMFTGETGSGKAMVLSAIAFTLGERIASHSIRRDTRGARSYRAHRERASRLCLLCSSDEVDAGAGGATANAVGVRLGRLTTDAQIASWADEHYVLEKTEGRAASTIEVRRVSTQRERAGEIARILSGESHDTALKHARLLLQGARHRRLKVSGES